MDNFTSLHTHSEMSILDGASKVDAYFARAAELGQPALGITDHGSTSGFYQAWKAGRKHGVKPILGCEFYVAPGSRHDRSAVDGFSGQGRYGHLTVLAIDAGGIRSLYRLQSTGFAEGFYQKPRIDFDLLEEHQEGLVVLSGCASGHIATYLRQDRWDEAVYLAGQLRSTFGDRFFIEIMYHGIDDGDLDEVTLNAGLVCLAEHLDIPLAASNDAHYCNEEDSVVHDALLCVQVKDQIANEKRGLRAAFATGGFHLKSRSEMEQLPLPVESLDNTNRVADLVGDYDEMFEHRLRMPAGDGTMRAQATRGLEERLRSRRSEQ